MTTGRTSALQLQLFQGIPEPCDPVRSPIRWVGGKQRLAAWIAEKLPRGRVYVEPFGGGASVLLARPPSPIEVYNDADLRVVNFFRVLRDPELGPRLKEQAEATPYAIAEYWRAWETIRSPMASDFDRALAFFVANRTTFGGAMGHIGGFGRSKETSCPSAFASATALLRAVSERLRNVTLECGDWLEVAERYDCQDAVIYLDPPYHPDTLSPYQCYAFDSDHALHRAILDFALRAQGTVAVSGYDHPDYRVLDEAGFVRHEVEVQLKVKRERKGMRRKEVLWVRSRA